MTGFAGVVGRVQQLQGLLSPPGGASAGSGSGFASTLAAASGTGQPTGAVTGAASGSAVVADARRYLGVPYVWGGTDPATGLDCSGLVQRVYADLGVQIPRVSRDQATVGQEVPNLAAAQPGDILAFGHPVHHVGIYIGDGKMIDAPQPGDRVKVERVWETPATIRRVLPAGTGTSPSAAFADPALRLGLLTGTSGTSGAGAPYAAQFAAAASRYGLPANLLAAVAKVESGYDPGAVSPAGAQGLMQLMPGTAAGLGVDALDPGQAIDGAARLLAGNLRGFGSLPLALAAYNAGPGAVRKYGGIPPYAETQAYVGKVQAEMAALGGGTTW